MAKLSMKAKVLALRTLFSTAETETSFRSAPTGKRWTWTLVDVNAIPRTAHRLSSALHPGFALRAACRDSSLLGTSASHAAVPPSAHLDVDALLKQLDAVESQGTHLFDRMCVPLCDLHWLISRRKDALTVPYADEDAIGKASFFVESWCFFCETTTHSPCAGAVITFIALLTSFLQQIACACRN